MSSVFGKWKLMGALVAVMGLAGAASARPAESGAGLAPVVDAYIAAHEALSADDLGKAQTAGKALVTAATGEPAIAKAAAELGDASDLASARTAFGGVSKALIAALATNPKAATGLHTFHCPMAKGYGKWVQRTDVVQNPYMGKRMPHCGTHSEMTP